MNPNTSESNARYLQSRKEDIIDTLVARGIDRTTLEGKTLQELRNMLNDKLETKYIEDEKEYKKNVLDINSNGGKSKRKRRGKRKHSRGKRKGSRRHKTRRHSKK
jgi:hypothetical protein